MMMPDLSIIIVNWNTKDLLRNCLRSIHHSQDRLLLEIIVVDNDSSDDSCAMVQKEFPEVKLINNNENVGFAKANNQALRTCSGGNVLFLNPDTLVTPGALKKMVSTLDARPEVGAVGCRLTHPDGSVQYTCARSFPTPWNQFFEALMLPKIFPRNAVFGAAFLSHWDHKSSREVDCLSGACLMVKKDVLSRVGGFDERYFMYAEDVELCLRIKKASFRLYYCGDVTVIHYSAQGSRQKSDHLYAAVLMRQATYEFMRSCYGRRAAVSYKALMFIGSLFRLAIIGGCLLLPSLCKDNVINASRFYKYVRLVRWSLGLETWAAQLCKKEV